MKMEPLIELCDLIAQNPTQFPDKLTWLCTRCPPPEYLLAGSPRVSRSQLNAVTAVARFLSKCPDHTDHRPQSVILEFLRSIPASFHHSFWPQSFGTDSIASFYADFLGYVSKATELSSDFATEVAGFVGEIVITAVGYNVGGDLGNSRVFLRALSKNFLPVLPSDAGRLVACLLDNFVTCVPNLSSPRALSSSSQSSPINESFSPRNDGNNASGSSSSLVMNGVSVAWKGSVDQSVTSIGSVGLSDGGGGGGGGGGSAAASYRQMVVSFEDEPLESLEKQEIAFNLIAHIVEKGYIDPKLLEQVRIIAKEQLQSMSAFLKVNSIGVQFSIHCANIFLGVPNLLERHQGDASHVQIRV